MYWIIEAPAHAPTPRPRASIDSGVGNCELKKGGMLTRARFASRTAVDKYSSAVTEMEAHSHDNGAWKGGGELQFSLVAREGREDDAHHRWGEKGSAVEA